MIELITKKLGTRIIEFLLAVHVWIHIVEFIAALYERAYITATIAAIGILTFISAAIFLENGHNHITIKQGERYGN